MLPADVRAARLLAIMSRDTYLGVDSRLSILKRHICEEFTNIDRLWNMEEMSAWVKPRYRSKILDGHWRAEAEVAGGHWPGGDEIMKTGTKLSGHADDGLLVM